jgi:hypothetical protein
MTRILLALILGLTSVSASAVDWPWDAQATGESPEYCKGLVVGGLASRQLRGMSRVDLWLAWSYVIRAGALNYKVATEEYLAGLAQLQNAPDAASAESTLQLAQGDCGLGRSGRQITGW